MVQTGPKTAAGGLHAGLRSVGYQEVTDEAVKMEPIPPTARQMAMKRARTSQGRCRMGAEHLLQGDALGPVPMSAKTVPACGPAHGEGEQ